MDGDTIAALSTPLGRGGIAVIRISGPKTTSIIRNVVAKLPSKIQPRRAYHGFVTDGPKHIDECVTVFFQGPRSYTGEDVAEISIHSNPFLVEEALNLVLRQYPGETRPAMPGEFTYRAFKAGKMDLIQAESVNELINANSKYFAHMKFGSLEGRLSRMLESLKQNLIHLGVRIETKIEFEEDQFFDPIPIADALTDPLKRLDTLLANARFNELLDKGLNVVIIGKVNVGKSSLFNTLLMEERSIISHVPGTTRDFIKEKLYIDGFPIDITDVAGINRDTDCDIETQGIKRSLEKVESCDAAIFMLDASRPLEETDREIYQLIKDKKKIIVANKLDKISPEVWRSITSDFERETLLQVSVKEHLNIEGITHFLKGLIDVAKGKETDFAVNQRQRLALEELRTLLRQLEQMALHQADAIEIIAEEIRRATTIIGRLMGEITPDDILDKIFSEFCVGK